MPGLRFAIGAALAVALLIVAVFGLAATVQVAHRRSVTVDDPWRTLAFPDPTDWGLLADRSRPASVAKTEPPEVPQARLAVTVSDPETAGAVKTSEREAPQETEAVEAAELPTLAPAPATVPAIPLTAPTHSTVAPPQHESVDVVAAIPETKAAPVQRAEIPPTIEVPASDDEPLEPSERVGALPGFPTAGHGFVPPEHPIALPVPLPPTKPAVKKPQKKRVARSRPRLFFGPPFANTGYRLFGYDKLGPDGKTAKTTGYDKIWIAE
jgi:hypothetical protein